MKTFRLIAVLLLASFVFWTGYWKAMGQDLNLFARQVLPIPIISTVVISGIMASIINGLYRLIKGRWIVKFPMLIWILWGMATLCLVALLTTTSA